MEEIGPTSVVSSYYYYYYKKNKRCQDSETPTRITMPAPCAMAFRSGPGPAVTARSAARGDPLHTPTWPPDLACRACRTRVKPRATTAPAACMYATLIRWYRSGPTDWHRPESRPDPRPTERGTGRRRRLLVSRAACRVTVARGASTPRFAHLRLRGRRRT